MSKSDRAKKRQQKRTRYAKPSAPRVIGANDNIATANDNSPVTIRGIPLSESQAYRFQVAVMKQADSDLSIQRDGHRMMMVLEREIMEQELANEAAAGLEERKGLEALRGVEIVPSRIEGAVGAPEATRDGLKNLTRPWTDRETGEEMPAAIPQGSTLHAAALLYRTDYERIDPERLLTPPQLDPAKIKVAHGGEGWDDKRREIEDRVFTVKLMICGVDAPQPGERRALPRLPAGHPAMRAIYALDEIAGKGMSLSDLTSSGYARSRLKEDLLFALEACEIVYGLA